MAEVKPGEVIKEVLEQHDNDGFIISRVTFETFGYNRDTANLGTQSILQSNIDLIKEWDMARKGGPAPK